MLSEPTSTGLAPVALDADALERLRELDVSGTIQLVVKVVRAFETSVARHVPQLRVALVDGDRAKLLYHAHTLKSSSAYLGATDLSHCCAVLEKQAAKGEHDALGALVDEIEALAGPTLLALHALPEVAVA